ncbi:glycosyltransferase family 2 protein [Rosistilla oblonga]|uniref:glycosyltransferase family 2 protein n=1 Tax=Rosistilla oblonga TaxID=2527990 RepID=UPI003A977990
MKLESITPLVLTYEESPNLRATLQGLAWAKQVIVVDSGSADGTLEIAAEFSQVKVLQRPFDNHTSQWNHGLQLIETDWVLTLDADYVCPAELADELVKMSPISDVYYSRFQYCVFGRQLRGSLYPPRAVLFRPKCREYIPDGHTQTLDVADATTAFLNTVFLHDDRKPMSRWCASQVKYAILEAEKLSMKEKPTFEWKDRIREKIVLAPLLTLFYCLFAKRLILDGWAGIFYTFQRVFAELILSLVLLERKFKC